MIAILHDNLFTTFPKNERGRLKKGFFFIFVSYLEVGTTIQLN